MAANIPTKIVKILGTKFELSMNLGPIISKFSYSIWPIDEFVIMFHVNY